MSTATINSPTNENPRNDGSPILNHWFTVHRSFIRKELRQSAFVLLLGTAAVCFGLFVFCTAPTSKMLFISGEAAFVAAWIVVPFVIALGLSQSTEFNRRSSIFLLHMPICRGQLIRGKLTLGGLSLLLILGLPILVAALAYSMPHRNAPFHLSMTADLWRLVLTSSMIYLASFLCGVRPANWFGTRLLPIAGVCIFAITIQMIPFWWLIAPFLILFVDWLLITTILFFAETRDYA